MDTSGITDLFTPEWRAALSPTIEAGMTAEAEFFDPEAKSSSWTNEDGWTTNPANAVYSGKVRVIPIRDANVQRGELIQRVRVQFPFEEDADRIRIGMAGRITECEMNPWITSASLNVVEPMGSSNPITRSVECTVNQAYTTESS